MSCLLYHDLRCAKEKKSLHHDSISRFACFFHSSTKLSAFLRRFVLVPPSQLTFFRGWEKLQDNMMMCVNLIKEGVQMRAFFCCRLLFPHIVFWGLLFFNLLSSFLFAACRKFFLSFSRFLWWHNARKKKGKMFFNMLVAGLYEFTTFKRLLIGMVEMRKRQ